MGDELSDKQAAFVREYLTDFNGTQAAIRAGYAKNTAESQACRLLGYAKVQQAVAEGQKQKAQKSARTALDVLEDIQACTRQARDAGNLNAAFKGLELEGKHIGMFRDNANAEDLPMITNLVIEVVDARKQD